MDTKNTQATKIIIGLLLLIVAYFGINEFQNYQEQRKLEIAVNNIKDLPNTDSEMDNMVKRKTGEIRVSAVTYSVTNETFYAFCDSSEYKNYQNELARVGAEKSVCSITSNGDDFIIFTPLSSGEYYCVTSDEQDSLSNAPVSESCNG